MVTVGVVVSGGHGDGDSGGNSGGGGGNDDDDDDNDVLWMVSAGVGQLSNVLAVGCTCTAGQLRILAIYGE
jgi:hypothetical protein